MANSSLFSGITNVEIMHMIGKGKLKKVSKFQGNFGAVYYAKWNGVAVAAKVVV